MKKKSIIVANWKMNPPGEITARNLFNSIKDGIKENVSELKNCEVIICPPFVYLPLFQSVIAREKIPILRLGAQNCFWEEKGPFTGEISPKMLKNFGVKYVIVGHSERRNFLKETDEMINKKMNLIFKSKIIPILCIGEKIKERKEGKTFQALKEQLKRGLKGIFNFKKQKPYLLIAYEPVWSIGTKNPCPPEMAKKVLFFLRKIFKEIPILYGGSLNSKIAPNYLKIGFDGLLVGGASLNSKEFKKILKNVNDSFY